MDVLQEDNTEEVDLAIVAPVVVEENESVVISLVTGEVSVVETSEVKKSNGKKGRPVVHPFAGRITLLREEVLKVQENPDMFMALMEETHGLNQDRVDVLGDKLDSNTMDYTFCGPIAVVIKETLAIASKYENDDTVEDVWINFKKKKIITDEKNPLYVAPVTDGKVVKNIEAYPDRLYGFVSVTFK